jgi:hypothetical protein
MKRKEEIGHLLHPLSALSVSSAVLFMAKTEVVALPLRPQPHAAASA